MARRRDIDRPIGRHTFLFNSHDNGGEALILSTVFFADEFDEIYTSQEFSLQSYRNSASFTLMGAPITSDLLRELANELDKKRSTLQQAVQAES